MNSESEKKLKLGIFTKFLIAIYSLFYIVSGFNKNFNLIYAQIPLFTVKWLEIYRLITGIFISNNLFDFFLNISVLIGVINTYENKQGTIKTFTKFFVNAFIFQVLILIFTLSVCIVFPMTITITIKPTLCIGLAMLTKHILQTDSKIFAVYPRIKLNDRWMLVLFLFVGLLLNFSEFKFEFILAIYYGFLICRCPKYFDYSPNEEEILHLEKNEHFKSIFSLNSWILIEECFFNINSPTSLGHNYPQVENLDDLVDNGMTNDKNDEREEIKFIL